MVITDEVKEKFKKCINTTIIFCTNEEQVRFLGKLYNRSAFKDFKCGRKDIEVYFKPNNYYGWQDGYNFKYLKSQHYMEGWRTITFDKLFNFEKCYELW